MFGPGGSPAVAVEAVLGQRTSAVDALVGLDLSRVDRDELLALVRGVETQRRRLPAVDHGLVAELDQRGVAGELMARDTKTLLRDVLRLSPRQAKARYTAAVDLGPRRGLTGEVLALRSPAPLAPVRILKQPTVKWGNHAGLVVFTMEPGMIFLTTLYLQQILRFSPLTTGLIFGAPGLATPTCNDARTASSASSGQTPRSRAPASRSGSTTTSSASAIRNASSTCSSATRSGYSSTA